MKMPATTEAATPISMAAGTAASENWRRMDGRMDGWMDGWEGSRLGGRFHMKVLWGGSQILDIKEQEI